MWVLPAQSLDEIDQNLDRALTLVSGVPVHQLTPAERAAIHAVYQVYEQTLGQPHPALQPACLAPIRLRLHDAYDQVQVGGRLAGYRSLLLATANHCPYCGFGEVKDLDHYLPRSLYGELAIYPNNLIPSCNPCNNAKRTVVPGTAASPGLIHAYFQNLPDVDFLVADVSLPGGGLDVSYRIDPALIDPVLATKLQYQLDRLKLNERYVKQINKFVNEQRAAILMFDGLGPGLLAAYLEKNAQSLAASFHRNDWRAALFRALAANPVFCDDPHAYLGDKAA